jgi:hypothetical protein
MSSAKLAKARLASISSPQRHQLEESSCDDFANYMIIFGVPDGI